MIRHPLTSATFYRSASSVIDLLVRELPAAGLHLERVEPENGMLWARGISKAFDMILWRCYSDRFLFEAKERSPSETNVSVWMIVNLLLWPPRKDRLIDKRSVARWVQSLAEKSTPRSPT